MRIYLDNCCYSRPSDDQSQNRIYDESNAILSIIKRITEANGDIIGSDVLVFEMSRNPDSEKLAKSFTMYESSITTTTELSDDARHKAKILCDNTSIRRLDAWEVLCAQEAGADYFVSTDDKLIKACQRTPLVSIKVINPINLLSIIAEKERSDKDD